VVWEGAGGGMCAERHLVKARSGVRGRRLGVDARSDGVRPRMFHSCRDAACRFVSVRARHALEGLRFVPVRVTNRVRVTRFVSRVSEICLHVMRVGLRVFHCVFVCFCVSLRVMRVACHACRVPCVSNLLRVMRVACYACLDRLRFGSCPCQVMACLRFVFVFARPCSCSRLSKLTVGTLRAHFFRSELTHFVFQWIFEVFASGASKSG
jgi:hypothetical protein